ATALDAASGGLGGCPFAPGATGNTASEDLVYALQGGGLVSDIDLPRLLHAADLIAALPGGKTESHLRRVPRDTLNRPASAPASPSTR
ncbi:MAG: hydroxymethylglutaryl-CoA lyase, partial [Pseudomonadota bacterium]|nr:hydroxymethylglutaryl-CoA lyase [Pseudomonadota bacterium]